MNRLPGWIVALLVLSMSAYNVVAMDSLAIDLDFEPRFAKVKGLILPGDLLRFTIKVRSSELTSGHITLVYEVTCISGPATNPIVSVVRRGDVSVLLVDGVGSASLDIEVPWCKGLSIEVASTDAHTVSSRLTIDIGPEIGLSLVEPRDPFLGERHEGGTVIIRVLVRTNVGNVNGSLIVRDETLGLTIRESPIELVDRRVYELYVRLPENPRRLFILKDWLVLHNITVSILSEGADSYAGNNVINLYVVVVASDMWRIPWAVGVAFGFIVALITLAYVSRRIFA